MVHFSSDLASTHPSRTAAPHRLAYSLLAVVGLAASLAIAQQNRDEIDQPQAAPHSSPTQSPLNLDGSTPADSHTPEATDSSSTPPQLDSSGRRLMTDEPTVLAFRNVSIEQVIPFIVETTGKVVLPQPDILSRRITLLNDQPIARQRALDLVFLALHQANIAVVESSDLILLRDLTEIDRQDVPVLRPEQSSLLRSDQGSIIQKVFQLHNGSAENIGEIIKGILPSFAKLNVDAESNQLVLMGNVGLVQRVELLISTLDQPNAASLSTETFHLRYADATAVAQNIKDLFTQQSASGTQAARNQPPEFVRFFQGPGSDIGRAGRNAQSSGNTAPSPSSASTSSNLRVTANTQQNSITVLAERTVLEQVREQIVKYWDQPLPEEAVVPRIYDLKNSDPVKVKDLLTGLFGRAQGTGTAGSTTTQGVGRLAGQFSFEAIAEKNQLVVVGKSPDNLAVIDRIIQEVDRPQTAGLPRIVELKHASAEELAEQLNALLSQEGTLAQIPRQETGLTDANSTVSPFASDQSSSNQGSETTNTSSSTAGNIQFWWQRARPPTTTAGSSNLVSKIRIVPVWRQNALMILSPPEYQESVVNLIADLDKPGRQVLLAAVIAEINKDDLTALGLRWSSQTLSPSEADNSVSLGAGVGPNQETFAGQKTKLLPGLFDTSVLDVGVDLNLLLQALSQKTNINIISEPRIFTSDNQEAEFFSGQDIPFITDSQTTDNGTLNQSFDYRAVGIQLRVRPRITVKKDVDLRVNLELSSIQPNQTLFGGFIVDRRETTTHLIVRDGQTVVVSGILRSEDSEVIRKVPLLGDIPLLGEIFKSREKTKSNTELVAFITPVVIENPEDAGPATQPDQNRLKSLRRELAPESAPDSTEQNSDNR